MFLCFMTDFNLCKKRHNMYPLINMLPSINILFLLKFDFVIQPGSVESVLDVWFDCYILCLTLLNIDKQCQFLPAIW